MDFANLWKKEGHCADAQYIKIFDLTQSKLNNGPFRMTERKNNSVSSGKNRAAEHIIRFAGPDTSIWNWAMEECNTSLRFGEIGSTNSLIAI